MIVVSDATPLITLMKAQQLNILNKLFGDVIIPGAMYQELTSNELFSEEAILIQTSPFIRVVYIENANAVSILRRAAGLDLGESEAIVYADEKQADLLLMDEYQGRRVATDIGLKIMGSIGVLVNAFREGILSSHEAEAALERIRKANRHISERLIQDALDLLHDES